MATHKLGPDDATLTVRTGKSGAAAMAGHNLLMEVTSWSATLALSEDSALTGLTLTADSRSFKVDADGAAGIHPLGEEDKSNIAQTIDDEVLKGGEIEFRSDSIEQIGERLRVHGELNLLGQRRPLMFEVSIGDDGRIGGEVTLKQSDWGIKPYSALFGTLKVADELRVVIDGRLPAS